MSNALEEDIWNEYKIINNFANIQWRRGMLEKGSYSLLHNQNVVFPWPPLIRGSCYFCDWFKKVNWMKK